MTRKNITYKRRGDPLLHAQCSAHSDHSAEDGQGSLKLQVTPDAGFPDAQTVPTVYGNAFGRTNKC